MKKLISFCVILCTLFLMGCQHSTSEIIHISHELEQAIVKIGEQSWTVEMAKTNEERQQGLMFRESLEADKGMLFVFPNKALHAFWMKNTLIPLDVIWISEDLKVVDVQMLNPCKTEECPLFQPKEEARFVLEIPAGTFKGRVGDSLKIGSPAS